MAKPKKVLQIADKMDRFRALYAGELKESDLTTDEKETIQRYRRVGALLTFNVSIQYAMRNIATEFSLSESQSYAIVRQAMILYGDVMKLDKEGRRYFMYERFLILAMKAEKAEDFSTAESCLEKAAKLYNLYTTDSNLPDPRVWLVPVPINFQVIKPEQKLKTINIDEQ
jgi:hypothetical protein